MSEKTAQSPSFEWIDRPIISKSEDRLNRIGFAKDLARAVRSWDGKDSLVIGLYGNWGSGKTSIKNMMLEALHGAATDGPTVIEFNPWRVAGFDQLAESFFTEIHSKLPSKLKSLKKAFKSYREQLDSATLDLKIIKISAKQRNQSLEDLRKELLEEFRKCPIKFLVIIDDIDRLPQKQISLLFQIIKANADFPNMTYLVLFHHSIVSKALNQEYLDGSSFLEKIVQVAFDVPEPNRHMIQQVLFDGLDKLIASEQVNKRFDKRRWINIFVPGIAPYFNTLRDVNRFLSTLSFTMGFFTRNACFEVNLVDLIALEVLRVFEPDIYHQIPYFKNSFVKLSADNDKDISGPILNCVKNSSKNP